MSRSLFTVFCVVLCFCLAVADVATKKSISEMMKPRRAHALKANNAVAAVPAANAEKPKKNSLRAQAISTAAPRPPAYSFIPMGFAVYSEFTDSTCSVMTGYSGFRVANCNNFGSTDFGISINLLNNNNNMPNAPITTVVYQEFNDGKCITPPTTAEIMYAGELGNNCIEDESGGTYHSFDSFPTLPEYSPLTGLFVPQYKSLHGCERMSESDLFYFQFTPLDTCVDNGDGTSNIWTCTNDEPSSSNYETADCTGTSTVTSSTDLQNSCSMGGNARYICASAAPVV